MKQKYTYILISFFVLGGYTSFVNYERTNDDTIVSYTANPTTQDIQLYWKDDKHEVLRSIQNLKTYVESKHSKLIFAANAGMYQADNSPLGLFIQHGKMLTPLNTRNGSGNFYLKPNGIFYITTTNKAAVCETGKFSNTGDIKFATQSGPMLVVDGKVHSAFTEGSKNINIRNGVGILSDGKILFAMSKKEINFYDFAAYFQKQGCVNALYLDGFVSRTYLPEKQWVQTDGNFGVMIGVVQNK
jgi:uncharacterized protein YigE (DUF2233 family)